MTGTAQFNDAELVAESLKGNREAFRQIVERYQTLITSVAYCATGNTGLSEDIAQETFVTAWKQLANLREPDKLRAWLCGIARFRIGKEFRRLYREPVHRAESLESMDERTSPEPMPPDHVISDEERALLWRSLERVPEIYREPLVLYYREHQSIEAVAHDLDLSEDAVKQRLSRGRKLLQEQFLGFVAGALKQTAPGKTFTLGVLAALPLMAPTAKAASAGASAAAAKGSAVAKATGLGAIVQAVVKVLASGVALLSPLLLVGGFFGFKMGGDARGSLSQRESVATFWRIVVGCLVVFVVLPLVLLLAVLALFHGSMSEDLKQKFLAGLTVWLGVMYLVVPAALILWGWQRRREVPPSTAEHGAAPGGIRKKRLVVWVVIAMLGAASLLILGFLDSNHNVQHKTPLEVQKLIADGTLKNAKFNILQYQNGFSYLWISFEQDGKPVTVLANADAATVAAIKSQNIPCPTYVQGRDFEVFGWPGRFLPLFCIFILAIGVAMLLRRPGKVAPETPEEIRKREAADRLARKLFGTGAALMLLVTALPIALITRWHVHHLTAAEMRQLISQHKDATFFIYQFSNGSKEIMLTQKASVTAPIWSEYQAPADDTVVAALTEQGVSYRTFVQGRDFGYADPQRWLSSLVIALLLTGAGLLIRWAWKQGGRSLLLPSN